MRIDNLPEAWRNTPVLFFDGVCNVCNVTIQFILKHEREQVLHFAPLQSEAAQYILPHIPPNTDSLVLYQDGEIYLRSSAALHVAGYLDSPYHLLEKLLLIPAFIRDPIYRLIARYRYTFFGKRESCMIPTPELKKRFL